MMGPRRPKALTEREAEVREEYLKTLQDLTFNSKPLIDVLTEVAAESKEYAACIVDCIEEQLENVSAPLKLPILYLADSIMKCETIKQHYLPLFCSKIQRMFIKVYEQGDEDVRSKLAKLRFTWNGVLPAEILTALDNAMRTVNSDWQVAPTPAIHLNPKFIQIQRTLGENSAKLKRVLSQVQDPQNSPAFRIAPVSSQLINAAAKRSRDLRLQKSTNAPLQKKTPSIRETATTVNGRRDIVEPPTSQNIDAKNDKRNESPEKSSVLQATTSEPEKAVPRTKKRKAEKEVPKATTSKKKKKSASKPEKAVPRTKKRKAEKEIPKSASPKPETSNGENVLKGESSPPKTIRESPPKVIRESPPEVICESSPKLIRESPPPVPICEVPPQPVCELPPVPPVCEVPPQPICVLPPPQPICEPPRPMFPFLVPGIEYAFPKPPNFGMLPTSIAEVPIADENAIKMIDRDPMTRINIDGVPREIRHYGSYAAVVFLNWDEPREILFMSHDIPRRIVIDGKYTIDCMLNAPDVERMIYGKPHKFRLGAPTRELYIDGVGYECYFGGAPIKVWLDGRLRSVKLEGIPPKADIGRKRLDLVAGKISMVINDLHTFPLFLDAKPQKIEVDGYKFVIVFADSLQRISINDVPFRTDFGGVNHSFNHCNKLFYFRLSALPVGIIPGTLNIYQMTASRLPSPPPLPPSLRYSTTEDFPVLPVLPVLPNIENYSTAVKESSSPPPPVKKDEETASENLSIDELVQKLLAKGLVSIPDATTSTAVKEPSPPPKPKPAKSKKCKTETNTPKDEPIKPVDLKKRETLTQKQPGMVAILYTGNQCGSCGLRFAEEQTLKYSEHLDWHFRLNRRGKDGARTIHSRRWYYKGDSWMQFQEMEDESDRGQSWFDNNPATGYTEEVIEDVPCVKASSNGQESCELCCDRFEQFYNQELEEWQLRNAISVDDKFYHPICFQDHKDRSDKSDDVVITNDEIPTEEIIDEPNDDEPNEPDQKETIEEIKKENNDDDDDDDSDLEEVQLIEVPIEEIVIQDDANDPEDTNLETLHMVDIIDCSESASGNGEPPPPGEETTVPFVPVDLKPRLRERITIPLVKKDTIVIEPEKSEISDFSEPTCGSEEPPPPGEQPIVEFVPADLKPRLRERKLTEYPPVKKGTGDSGLCSIM